MQRLRAVECTVDVPASPEAVFDLLHDYDRRLDWDPFLREARILGEDRQADVGVRTLCRARAAAGGGAMETVYLTFRRPDIAAVDMIAGPFYISRFAASMRQAPLPGGHTRLSYKFRIAGRPRWLGFILDPILAAIFRRETRRRLLAFRRQFE